MHSIQQFSENLIIEIPLGLGQDLIDERLAQAAAVNTALEKLLKGEINPDTYIQMIEPTIGNNQIDNYLEETILNLDG